MINSFFNKSFILKWNIFILKVFHFSLLLSVLAVLTGFNKLLILIKPTESVGLTYFI